MDDPEQALDHRLAPVLADSKTDLAFLRQFDITTAEQFEAAAATRAKFKATLAEIEADRKALVDPKNKWVKVINAKCKPATDFLAAAVNLLNASMGAFQQREEARQRAALEEVQAQAQAGDIAGATLALARVESQAPQVAGLSSHDDWYVVSVDQSKLPPEYLVPDMVKINAVTKSAKTESPIPGVVAACRKVITQRSAK